MKLKENKAKSLVDNAIHELIESIEQGHSEKLTQYLQTMGKFHKYSFHNTLLIALQRPRAIHVAGFVTWKKLGRFIKSGEKGIAIIAPMIYNNKDSTQEDAEKEIRGFRVAYVFDVAQTDGEELPEVSQVQGNPEEYSEKLNDLIATYKITLEYQDNLQAYGYSSGDKIVIRSGLSPAEDFSVRVHEIAHELQIIKDREKRLVHELNKLKQDIDSLKSGRGIVKLLMTLQNEKNINFLKLLNIEGFDKEFQEII